MKNPGNKAVVRNNQQSKKSSGFFPDLLAELKKIVWPTRRDGFYLTSMVVIVAVIVGLFLGGVDWIYSQLVNGVLLGG
ncbi:MAG: preprotein translocase subunit SecE [Chloroflexi bacterium]|jgi:preprotein translocase subunit SecE|nr:preprotein translocase subunit SecE [Chloroflexota bacterium]